MPLRVNGSIKLTSFPVRRGVDWFSFHSFDLVLCKNLCQIYGTLLAAVAIDEEQGGTLKVYTAAMNLVATTIDAGWRKVIDL